MKYNDFFNFHLFPMSSASSRTSGKLLQLISRHLLQNLVKVIPKLLQPQLLRKAVVDPLFVTGENWIKTANKLWKAIRNLIFISKIFCTGILKKTFFTFFLLGEKSSTQKVKKYRVKKIKFYIEIFLHFRKFALFFSI